MTSRSTTNGSFVYATSPSRYLFCAYDTAKDLGYDVEKGLQRLGLRRPCPRDPEERIRDDTFQEAMLWLLARVDYPGFGLIVGHRQGLAQHGMLGFAFLSSANLKQAIDVYIKYERVLSPPFPLSYSIELKEALLTWQPTHPLGPLFIHYAEENFADWQQVISTVLDDDMGFSEVCFNYAAPHYEEMYRELFGCSVRFDTEELQMRIPTQLLSVPFKFASEPALEVWQRECESMLQRMGGETGLIQEVQGLLLRKPGEFAELNELAGELNMSPRTLRRRLEEVGTSYRRLIFGLRMELASQYLSDSDLSFQQIASMVNYAQVSHFYQAFKRWSGKTPGEYRSAKQAQRSEPPTSTAG